MCSHEYILKKFLEIELTDQTFKLTIVITIPLMLLTSAPAVECMPGTI